MEQFDTLPIQCRHIVHMHEGVYNFCLHILYWNLLFKTNGHGRTDTRTDNVKTVYPLQTKFAGDIIIFDKMTAVRT